MDFDRLIEYQNMLQGKIKAEQQIDRKIEFLSIINEMTVGPRNIVQKEQIMIEAQHRGFNEKESEQLIEKLIEENIIYQPMSGYIKKR
jgi:DNA replicative helicase MCM subunit Mcm2 (Cdc46/Mcm family)